MALLTSAILTVFASAVSGAQYDLKEMTPAIQQAISQRQQRYDALQSLKASGEVGESNRGYISVLKSSANAESLTASENADRKIIYQAISDQNQLGSSGLGIIETVFSEVLREKAKSGDFIQSPSGQWLRK